MICYRLSFHPLRQDISKDILLSMSFSFLLSPSFAIFSAAFDAVFSRLTTLFFMGIVSCLGGVLAREWHASFCAYDNVCKIFTLFLKIQSCEGQNVRHIRRKYEKGAQVQ